MDVNYAELVSDPEQVVEQVRNFCGIPSAVPAAAGGLRPVTSASSGQVRTTIHKRGVGAWKRYAVQLEPLRARLAQHGIETIGQ
jgi:hypothetical protein